MTRERPIVIAGGGTAGHILPGLSIAEALVRRGVPRDRLRWIGSSRGQEASLVPPSGLELDLLPGRGIQRRLTLENVGAVAGLVVAAWRAFWIVGRTRPAVVLSLGGYASAAASAAAVVWRVPVVVAEQNAVAGAANRVIGRFARAAAVPFDGTGLPRAVVTGNPVRDEVLAVRPATDALEAFAARRRDARREMGLPETGLVVAVFAGSLGSRRINEAMAGVVESWGGRTDLPESVHVHHVVGRRDADTFVRPTVPDGGAVTYAAHEYEERMALLLAAADVAVCRSGGTTVAELAVVGLGGILVPLPIAPGDHQRHNAAALVAADAAVLLDDADCTPDGLGAVLTPLIEEPDRLRAMSVAAWGLGHPDAADAAAALVLAQVPDAEGIV